MKPNPAAAPWQRISHILKTESLSLQTFSRRLGLRRPFSLERIERGEDIISPELAARINKLYPAYSIPWLLLGRGAHPGAAPDELPDLSGSIIGKWNLTHTYNYFADTWDEEQSFAPDESAWRFQRNGMTVFYEHGEAIDIAPYTYDPATGHIRIRHIDAVMLTVTATRMEYLDWSEWPAGGLVKYIYKREPDKTKTTNTTDKEQTSSLFTGRWEVTGLYQKTGNEWKAYQHYHLGFFLWDFLSDGILLETVSGQLLRKTTYAFDPAENLLSIDRSDYAPDGFINACYEDQYWVEPISDTELWLYDTEEIKNVPEGCEARYFIKQSKIHY